MPSEHTGRSRDGSRKTSSLIRSEPTTRSRNLQKSKEKKPKRREKSYVNFVENVTATSQCVPKEADNFYQKKRSLFDI